MTPEAPFAPVCTRQSFLESAGTGGALRRLDDGLGAREPFLLVTGAPGTGKTTLAHEAAARWGSRVTAAFIAYPAMTGAELLEEVIRRFGAEPADALSRSKLVAALERALAEITGRGQVAVLVVDDAHALSLELLEELRLLVNVAQQVQRPLEVMLVGLPVLEARLNEPALAALRQRISVHVRLEPLSPSETRQYLHHRVTAVGGDGPTLFSRKTCRDIAARTEGVPRQINALAAEALRVANVWGDQTVGVEHVQTAAAALGGFAAAADPEGPDEAGAQDAQVPVAAEPVSRAPSVTASVLPPAAGAPAPKPVASAPAAGAPAPRPVTSAPAAGAPAPRPVPSAPAPIAPARAPSVPAASEVAPQPTFTPPASHDPREWVARFVGDQGPLQLSSRARPASTWEPEPPRFEDAESPAPGEPAAAARGGQEPAAFRARSRRGGVPLIATSALLAAIVAISAVALILRAGGKARGSAGPASGVVASALVPQKSGKASLSDKEESQAAARAGSAGESGAPTTDSGAAQSHDSAASSRGPFTLDVGGYRDLDRAYEQRDRMSRLTGFEGWIVPAVPGEDKPYRVVLGVYRSRQHATAAAEMLLHSRTLHYVVVVPLPPREVRQ